MSSPTITPPTRAAIAARSSSALILPRSSSALIAAALASNPLAQSGAVPLALLTAAGAASTGALTLSAGAGAPAGPTDPATPYLKLGASVPALGANTPAARVILTNRSVQTPVQPWLINADGTLFAAATSTISGVAPTFPGASSFTVSAPSGTDFLAGGGVLWIGDVAHGAFGYVTYGAYDPATHTFTSLDTRYAGTPALTTHVYQVQMPRLEPGNTGTLAGATSWGTGNWTMPGTLGPGLKIAMQNLVAVEAGGFGCGLLAWQSAGTSTTSAPAGLSLSNPTVHITVPTIGPQGNPSVPDNVDMIISNPASVYGVGPTYATFPAPWAALSPDPAMRVTVTNNSLTCPVAPLLVDRFVDPVTTAICSSIFAELTTVMPGQTVDEIVAGLPVSTMLLVPWFLSTDDSELGRTFTVACAASNL